MAKKTNKPHDLSTHRKERIAYGIFVTALGCLWLASELGWFSTPLPVGPIVAIIIGFTMMLPWLKSD